MRSMVKLTRPKTKQKVKNMLKKRGAGVLLHISSMPSPYGVGVLDEHD